MNIAQHSLILAIRVYQLTLSPALTLLFGPDAGCRFEPSCSRYSVEAIKRHGAIHGGWLTLKRLVCCHPWGGSGYDPVPNSHGAQHPCCQSHRCASEASTAISTNTAASI